MPTWPQTKMELLEELHQASTELEQTLNTYSGDQMTDLHDQASWSIQDHLNHLATWEDGVAALLEHRPRYEAMGVDIATVQGADEDEENAIIRERTPKRTLAETLAALRAAHKHLLAALDGLSDADLFKPYSYYQPDEPGADNGKPIVAWVVGNCSGHYQEHLPWIKAIGAQGK